MMDTMMIQEAGGAVECGAVEWGAVEWAAVALHYRLSPRETQVLAAIWADAKIAAIAFDLGISIHTVDSHWREVQRKMGVKGRVAAVRKVADFRLEVHLAELRAALTPKMLPGGPPQEEAIG